MLTDDHRTEFRKVFAGSPIKRTGRDRFVRNVLIAIGNAREPALADVGRRLLDDPSPLVRAAAVWAINRLDAEAARAFAAEALPFEEDVDVAQEWRRVLGEDA